MKSGTPKPAAIAIDTVRTALLAIWGEQTCRLRPADWPRVLAELMRDAASSYQGGYGRASVAPLVASAVDTLASAFGADVLPDDPTLTVWRCFPRLDHQHCAELAKQLIVARGVKP